MSLALALPTPPSWRFPLPSPTTASLAPNIPIEAFRIEVENPLTAPSPLHEEVDEIEEDLSPSSSVCSRPSTPQREKREREDVKVENDSEQMWREVERTESRMSIDSKETVRPGYAEIQGEFVASGRA